MKTEEKIKELNNLKRSLSANRNTDKKIESIKDLSSRTLSKIIQKMLDDKNFEFGCSNCGWDETIGDIHHIRGRNIKDSNDPSNLSYLCPNCHRKVHKNLIQIEDIISFRDQVGDKWKTYCPPVRSKTNYSIQLTQINKELKLLKEKSVIERLKKSDIDFTKYGWVNEASRIIGVTPQKVGKWLERVDSDFYSFCYKRK